MYLSCVSLAVPDAAISACIPSVIAGSGVGLPAVRDRALRRAPECKSALPDVAAMRPASDAMLAQARLARARCPIVQEVVAEMLALTGERDQMRRDRRRTFTHIRQIAMYVCHVVLQLSLTDIGIAFGRDRTTVSYSCHVVEDRRDDPDFDAFVAVVERIIASVFAPAAGEADA